MKNTLKVLYKDGKGYIVMDRTFEKFSRDTRSEEYAHLQSVRQDYPEYTVITRRINKNVNMEHYKGLTYDYMRDYILRKESSEKAQSVIAEFDEMILLSKCHSKRYPVIKSWFLEKYPEVKEYGVRTVEQLSAASQYAEPRLPFSGLKETASAPIGNMGCDKEAC